MEYSYSSTTAIDFRGLFQGIPISVSMIGKDEEKPTKKSNITIR